MCAPPSPLATVRRKCSVTRRLHAQAYGGHAVVVWSEQDDLIGSGNHVRYLSLEPLALNPEPTPGTLNPCCLRPLGSSRCIALTQPRSAAISALPARRDAELWTVKMLPNAAAESDIAHARRFYDVEIEEIFSG
jgi:hypothetical protein